MPPLRLRVKKSTTSQSYTGTASIGAYTLWFHVTQKELASSAGFTLVDRVRNRVEQHRARLRAERRKRPGRGR